MIRDGTYDDIPSILAMSERFWQDTIYNVPFCAEDTEGMVKLCIDQGLTAVLVKDDALIGFICAFGGPLLCNHSVKTCTDIAWWVEPEHRHDGGGVQLIDYLEVLAKKAGMTWVNMVYMQSSMPEQVQSIYEDRGYVKVETVSAKRIM